MLSQHEYFFHIQKTVLGVIIGGWVGQKNNVNMTFLLSLVDGSPHVKLV